MRRAVRIDRVVVRGVGWSEDSPGQAGLDRAVTAALTARLRAAAPSRDGLPVETVAAQVAARIADAVRRERR